VTTSAGDSVAHNLTQQTIDPWPKHSRSTHIQTDGKVAETAVVRYQTGRITLPVKNSQLANPPSPIYTPVAAAPTVTGTTAPAGGQ
jgi:hypothetical protein